MWWPNISSLLRLCVLLWVGAAVCSAYDAEDAALDKSIAELQKRIECKLAAFHKSDGSYEKCQKMHVTKIRKH
ncbi:hypothetical protein ONE63_011503 [Megalurothrips usitatus]|uniref:Uncharacterized protein n=1 Tax=Megalurothrips usitatus TaxID=439358 RepID=A0AAV7WZ51_9NEOP|nr:hypothetical protein ONE63_011503 [Megalurothrips usitatus]